MMEEVELCVLKRMVNCCQLIIFHLETLLEAYKVYLDNTKANQYEQWLKMIDVDTINICLLAVKCYGSSSYWCILKLSY